MATPKKKLDLLISEGERFSYINFASSMSEHGYPQGLSPEWVGWTRRVRQVVKALVGTNSAPMAMLEEAQGVPLLGNGQDKFDLAKSQYLGALRAVREMLEDDRFDELTPTTVGPPRTTRSESGPPAPSPAPVVTRTRDVVPKLVRNKRLDKYELIDRLGSGFSAEVWKARLLEPILGVDLEQDAIVAVKVYSVGNRGYETLRVEREFGIASQLVHDNLAKVYDLVLSPNRPFHTFMVMEYVPGPTLKDFIESHGTLDPSMVLAIATQIFRAMTELHSLDAIHRDIKAANIIMPKSDVNDLQIKLVDLGIVSIAAQSQVTAASAFMGSKHSAPLEQLKGEQLDARVDVYGAGSVLFHSLLGRPMYDRIGPEGAIVAQMLSKDNERLPANRAEPEWIQSLHTFTNKCIEVDRDSRPRSAKECLETVEAIARMREESKSPDAAKSRSVQRRKHKKPGKNAV
ncbi:MAG: serine/threonine protein kinase [Planctomycetes bacterium]|nr:serine/threonine protein kinase [Planctomycetota bacterium]